MEAERFPAQFADLEPLVMDWAWPTQQLRNDKRATTPLEELDAFYNTMLPRVCEIAAYIDGYPLDAMPDHVIKLLDLCRMLMEIAPSVEVMRSSDVPCDFPRERIRIHQVAPQYTAAPADLSLPVQEGRQPS